MGSGLARGGIHYKTIEVNGRVGKISNEVGDGTEPPDLDDPIRPKSEGASIYHCTKMHIYTYMPTNPQAAHAPLVSSNHLIGVLEPSTR